MQPTTRRPEAILVVEDDPDVREIVSQGLIDAGHWVVCAENGRDALELLEYGLEPAVLLTDLMMPTMNGLELLQELRRRPELRPPRLLVMSANRGYTAEDLGVEAVLRKPFEFDELLSTVGGRAERVIGPLRAANQR